MRHNCNLCLEQKEREEITAFYFKSDITPQRYVLDKSKINDCDKHICNNCIEIVISDAK